MKKILMFGLSFLLLLSFASCGKGKDKGLTGTWGLYAVEENSGEVMQVDKLNEVFGEELGKEMKLMFDKSNIVVSKDNKVNFEFMGDMSIEGTVSEKAGKYTFIFKDAESGEQMEAVGTLDKDGKLGLESSELGKMVFKKK